MIEIIQNGHPTLRKIAEPVALKDITSPKIKKVLADMKKALSSQDDGVAIAAPQINVSLRIFVVSGKVFDEDFIRGKIQENIKHDDMVFINPVFLKKNFGINSES